MKISKKRLRKIIREAINEAEFYGETPAGQLVGTDEEDARFRQQLEAERIMKDAGLSKSEMSQVWSWMKADDNYEFYDSPQFEKLYGMLMPQMPYGIAKGRDGEPDMWILDYLNGDVGSTAARMVAK